MLIKRYNPIGFHGGPGGNLNGIGDYFKELDAAGVPFVIKMADNYGPLSEAAGYTNAAHVLVYRVTTAGQGHAYDYDVPDYSQQPAAAAKEHFDKTIERLPPEFDKTRVWLEPINEVDKERAEWLAEFADYWATLAMAAGYKTLWFGWSSGEPEMSHWRGPKMLDFLILAAAYPENIGLSLHEYSYSTDDLYRFWDATAGRGDLVGRVLKFLDVIEQEKIKPPTIFISEFGWEYQHVKPVGDGMNEIVRAAEMYAKIPTCIGAALWYLGSGYANIHNQAQQYIEPIKQWSKNWYIEIEEGQQPGPPVDGPPDPGSGRPDGLPSFDYRVVIEILPQDATMAEKVQLLEETHDDKRTITQAHKDGVAMVAMGRGWWASQLLGLLPSLLRIHYPERQPETEARAIEWGINYELVKKAPVIADKVLPAGWLDRLKREMGPIMNATYVSTSPMGAKREYGPHEGRDYDLVVAVVDSKEAVVAPFPGTVVHAGDKGTGYGYYVILKCQFEGITFYLWFGHMERDVVLVSSGQWVDRGTALGEIGTTGRSSAEHVHVNFQVPGYGKPGYIVSDVLDPALVLGNGHTVQPIPTGRFDLAQYVRGPNGVQYMMQTIGGGQERYNHRWTGDGFYIQKNDLWEWWRVTQTSIDLIADCSPDDGPDGTARYYVVKQGTYLGGRMFPRYWNVGASYSNGGHHAQFYTLEGCRIYGPNSGAAANNTTFMAHYPTIEFPTGYIGVDVIQTTDGNEINFWQKGKGRVGYRSAWHGEAYRTPEDVTRQTAYKLKRIDCFGHPSPLEG